MPITALPSNAVRAIGSTQTLSDSASIVKELIDNALDACASAISVEISTNALDIIQVKDNGHGIAPEDRGLVCRRYCTSKIRNIEDITNIGGSSLGFRGEALASAAETCDGLTISTRVEGEAVAVSLRFNRQGEILSDNPTSHPVGSTVRMVGFLKNLPVRRQTALKTTTKAFTKIRKILEAYALARPSTRISLKVLKAKSDKDNWMYAPRIGSTVVDAAIKVFGKEATHQCHWTTWEDVPDTKHDQLSTSVENNETSGVDDPVTFSVGCKDRDQPARDTFSIQALLPNTDCDYSAINNSGQYLAIDSRPVSCARGTLKQIIGKFKSYVQSGSSTHHIEALNNPILCMNIICPLGSYDINVEPAKDDVLFTDSEKVLHIVEKFFEVVFGDLPIRDVRTLSKKPLTVNPENFDIMLASRKGRETSSSGQTTSTVRDSNVDGAAASRHPIALHRKSLDSVFSSMKDDIPKNASRESRSKELIPMDSTTEQRLSDEPLRAWQANMYGGNELNDDDLSVAGTGNMSYSDDEADVGGDLRNVSVSNPWTIAKINAPVRQTPYMSSTSDELVEGDVHLPTPLRQSGDVEGRSSIIQGDPYHSESSAQFPLTPKPTQRSSPFRSDLQFSSPSPFPYPMKAWGKVEGSSSLPRKRKQIAHDRDGGDLETWICQPLDLGPTEHQDEELDYETRFSTDQLHPNGFVSARTLPTGTPLSAIPEAPRRLYRKSTHHRQSGGALNRLLTSPLSGPDRPDFGTGLRRDPVSQQTELQFVRNSQAPSVSLHSESEELDSVGNTSTLQTSQASARPMHPDLAITMDYERRKQEATRKLREQLRQQAKSQRRSRVEDDEGISPAENNSPHKNRYNKAIAALAPTSMQENLTQATAVFEPGDPRGYLLRCQTREKACLSNAVEWQPKAKRRKTSMLPLETVSEDSTVRGLNLTLMTSNLLTNISITKHHDEYINSGVYTNGLASAASDLTAQLSNLLKRSYRHKNKEIADLQIDLNTILRNHVAKYMPELQVLA